MASIDNVPDPERLRGLRAFVAAAHRLSFTRAAADLAVSPQAVAAAVTRLEGALGVRLLNRSTRSMALTEEGGRLAPLAADALARLDDALQAATGGAAPAGLVRVSVAGGFARRYVLPLLPALRRQWPRVQLELAMDDRKVDMVREGYDIAIRGGVLADAGVVSRRIAALSSVLVASPAYLKRAGVPRRAADLASHQLIGLRFLSGMAGEWTFVERGRPVTLEPRGAVTLSDPESIAQAAQLGLGIGAASIHHVLPALRARVLQVVLLDRFRPLPREMAIQYPHRLHLAPRVRAVVEFLVRAFADNADLQATPGDLRVYAAPVAPRGAVKAARALRASRDP